MRPHRVAVPLLATGIALGGCTADAREPAASPSSDATASATDLAPCPAQPDRPATGDAPDLTFDCLGGGTLDLARAAGTPTVLNLWASWCGPCREELPLMQQLAESGGDRVQVIGVDSLDGMPQATSFADDAGLTFPSAFDGEGQLAAALGLRGLPHTVFLAADGSVAYTKVGVIHSFEELSGLVAEHLGVTL